MEPHTDFAGFAASPRTYWRRPQYVRYAGTPKSDPRSLKMRLMLGCSDMRHCPNTWNRTSWNILETDSLYPSKKIKESSLTPPWFQHVSPNNQPRACYPPRQIVYPQCLAVLDLLLRPAVGSPVITIGFNTSCGHPWRLDGALGVAPCQNGTPPFKSYSKCTTPEEGMNRPSSCWRVFSWHSGNQFHGTSASNRTRIFFPEKNYTSI